MNKVIIDRLEPYNVNVNGSTYELDNSKSTKFVLCYRKAGSICGNHYHTGISINKNPEILYLLSGNVNLKYKFLTDDMITSVDICSPAKISVPAMIAHSLTILTDSIFFELNSLEDGKNDTIKHII